MSAFAIELLRNRITWVPPGYRGDALNALADLEKLVDAAEALVGDSAVDDIDLRLDYVMVQTGRNRVEDLGAALAVVQSKSEASGPHGGSGRRSGRPWRCPACECDRRPLAMTPDELKALADESSPGVWIAFEDEYGYHVENGLHEYTLGRGDTVLADTRLFALAPQLAREHAALLRWADQARVQLDEWGHEWEKNDYPTFGCAPDCGACRLLAALDAVKGGHQ